MTPRDRLPSRGSNRVIVVDMSLSGGVNVSWPGACLILFVSNPLSGMIEGWIKVITKTFIRV